uniref:ATP-dependent RNA helicase DHX8-like n=1 Tax=Doryrhamphus excisus TaxID=161450 RepID=UPI0025AE4534|nr:ATP-dependent RNA helicase DHX8-like [Doryrhamphus excisus]
MFAPLRVVTHLHHGGCALILARTAGIMASVLCELCLRHANHTLIRLLFSQLECLRKRWEGLVHVSELQKEGRVADVSAVSRGQTVKVKVLSLRGSKASLSMKDVDQETGEDLNPDRRRNVEVEDVGDAAMRNPDFPVEAQLLEAEENTSERKRMAKITDLEKWEIKQFECDTEESSCDRASDEDVEIDLVEEEPPFLRGQTKWSASMSPVKIVKNPDGSLSQAAMMQGALAKERRELKQAARAAEMDAIPTGLHKNWIDPMPDCEDADLMPEGHAAGIPSHLPSSPQMMVWKKYAFGGNQVSYGKKTEMSILRQRHSLPIFKLKEQLVQCYRIWGQKVNESSPTSVLSSTKVSVVTV